MTFNSSIAQHPTGLDFLAPDEYKKVPVADQPVSGNLPPIADLEWYFPKPGDQGQQLSCVAWATSYNKAYRIFDANGRTGSPDDLLQSPAFIYSALTGNQCNRGTYIPRALSFMTNVGSVMWEDMPYSQDTCNDWRQTAGSAKNRSTESFRLGSDPHGIVFEIQNHIAGGDPVIAAIQACEDFQQPVAGYIRQAFGSRCGGHAILIVGYDENIQSFRVLNSWGTAWGDGGKAWVSYQALLPRLREAYVDLGPDLNASGSNFLQASTAVAPENLSLAPIVTKEVLLQGLRVSVDPRVLRKFRDGEGEEKVSGWSLWLNVPKGFRLQIRDVDYELHHSTFHHPVHSQKNSSIFLGSWTGYGCVDSATIKAHLTDDSSVEADFNLCKLVRLQVPNELWPPATQ